MSGFFFFFCSQRWWTRWCWIIWRSWENSSTVEKTRTHFKSSTGKSKRAWYKLQGRCLWKGFSSTFVLEGKFNWWCNFKVPSIVRCLDQNWPQWFGQKELLLLIQVQWFRRKKKLPAGSEITLYEDFYIDLIHIRVNVKERSVFVKTIVFGWLGGRGVLVVSKWNLSDFSPPPFFPL